MKYMNTLLPAETLLVMEGKDCNLKRYLKAGFMHLLLRQVLKVQANDGANAVNGVPDKLVSAGKMGRKVFGSARLLKWPTKKQVAVITMLKKFIATATIPIGTKKDFGNGLLEGCP
jgi:hypothetical protein